MAHPDSDDATATEPPHPEIVARLVKSHREFLRFVEARVASRDVAQDILQSAFVKTLERGGAIRDGESAVAWFYRLLRNALVDHYRAADSRERAWARAAAEPADADDAALYDAVCRCVVSLVETLNPQYAVVLRWVDVDGLPVAQAAARLGISANNAYVRLHRARAALRRQLATSRGTYAEHGGLDCDCCGTAPRVQPFS